MTDYSDLDATELARRVREGETTPTELVEAALSALDAVDPQLHAVVHRMDEAARAQAQAPPGDGPFAGVPFVFKDLDGFLAGVPYTMGTRFLQGWVPDHDAEVVARMKRTGIIPIAKTACPELGLLATTEAEVWGPTRNPWQLDHSTGGSSGGTAALVAARAVPMGHGGDGGGSIRIPSSCCALFGLKPSRGRVPLGPDAGEGWGGYVQQHVLTRSVRDSAAMLDAIHGPMPGDPYAAPPVARPYLDDIRSDPGELRIAFSTGSLFGKTTHADCKAAVHDAAKLCSDLGHVVTEATPPIDRAALIEAYLVQVAAGVASEIEDAARWTGRTPGASDFEPATWFLHQLGHKLPAVALQRSRDTIHTASRVMAAFHADYDVFLDATLAYPPVPIGETTLKRSERIGLALLRQLPVRALLEKVLADLADENFERSANTMLFNQTGQPGMSVPLCWNGDGLPIGTQFIAPYGREDVLFRLAAQLEEARPWTGRKPPVCAAS